ncbi:MAG: hypothetical protein U1E40_01390 [Amaricoccus sp.]
MELLMNGLLMAGTLFAGGYCWILARRVRDLKSLDKGLGGAIVTLTRQIELARTTLDEAKSSSRDTSKELSQLVARADGAAGQLRILLAAAPVPPAPAAPAFGPAAAPAAPVAPIAATRAPAPDPVREPAAVRQPIALPEPAHEPEPMPHMGDVPKPRALAPVENPLRRRERSIPATPRSEDEILEALTALAGGR